MKTILISTLLFAAAGFALAEQEGFSVLDTDKDGLISLEEAKLDSTLSAAFTELDINKDGFLSLVEIAVKQD